MRSILKALNLRFQTIFEEEIDTSWKNPNSENYDRQWAEDALYHTIGPLTDHPRWADKKENKESAWTSPSSPVPGFVPGGPAPRWTPEEIVFAFAGDPNMLFSGQRNNPRSPEYGNKGGSPLFRIAKKVARYYARPNDRQFIADLYSNGFIPLVRMMQPGFDEGRSPFIPYTIRTIQGVMEHGTGGTQFSIAATGFQSEHGIVGFKGLLDKNDPNEIRQIADQVKGKYRERPSHDKHPDNPLGKYSASFYRLANQYADALESNNTDSIEATRNQIRQEIDSIEDDNVFIPGASTGLGQAISTADRKTSIGIASMDAPSAGSDDESGMAANMVGDTNEDSAIDPETITHILDIAINYDLGSIIGKIPKYAQMAVDFGAKGGSIGGKMGANELRYVIRTMGPLGSNYPGRGKMRTKTKIPRDSKDWWEPGSDPEIEPIPIAPGAKWNSIWVRNKYPSMGPTEIAQEMAKEVIEFGKLGIKTARTVKTKRDSRTGKEVHEAISKVAVSNTLRSATVKLKFIAMLERDSLGLSESISRHPLLEEIQTTDIVDRQLIAEACDLMCSKIEYMLVEKAPPGWKKTVKHMKNKGMNNDKAFSLAWSTYNNGGSKPDKRKKNSYYTNESAMRPIDALLLEETITCQKCQHNYHIPDWLDTELHCPKCGSINKNPQHQSYDLPSDKTYGINRGPRDYLGSLNRPTNR